MAQNPKILSPREPALHGKSETFTRTWYRFFDALGGLAGTLNTPITVAPNSIIAPGDLNSGSTVTLLDSPAGTILGNSSNVPGPPTPQVVDPSLSFENGTLAAQSLPPGTLAGNPAAVDAPASAIIPGANLQLSGNVLNVVPTGGGGVVSIGLVEAIVYWGM